MMVVEGPLAESFFYFFRRFGRFKGVLINTFYELEPYAIQSLSNGKSPKVYPIRPVLNLTHEVGSSKIQFDDDGEIMKWLDFQPQSSMAFLCFGSRGTFEVPQVKEIAAALEIGGGGGFISHCGWNSTLESVWSAVPMATFPLSAEQQLNAFQLVKEFRMAEAIRVVLAQCWIRITFPGAQRKLKFLHRESFYTSNLFNKTYIGCLMNVTLLASRRLALTRFTGNPALQCRRR
ncbi:hypothetical protein F511_39833 [Dorcoceras hygrometricum]|uniref:Uncharacterized protein n=1 Tax=Dorcoceras hygrometricum TaxID=472368 RepID=A0A2Z7C6C2_9LAMI|nr:hypothetical protein F511_39833 [Dorcoceras hygrometricum]